MEEKKATLTARLNDLGRQWSALEPEGNEAVREDLQYRIYETIYRWLKTEEERDAVGEFFLRDWSRFSAEKGDLSNYVSYFIKRRKRDLENKDTTSGKQKVQTIDTPEGEKKKRVWIRPESLDVTPARLDDTNETKAGRVPDEEAERQLLDIESEGLLMDLLSIVLTMPTRLQGRSNNPDRIHYFRLFFTDGLESFLYRVENDKELSGYIHHEKDVLDAMILPFLDFFKVKPCRTVEEISMVPVKRYEDMVENRVGEGLGKRPLPNDVYTTYFQKVEGKRKGSSAISQQRTAYLAFLKENFGC